MTLEKIKNYLRPLKRWCYEKKRYLLYGLNQSINLPKKRYLTFIAIRNRHLRFKNYEPRPSRDDALLCQVREKGFAVIKNAIEPQKLEPIKQYLETCLDTGKGLLVPSNDYLFTRNGQRSDLTSDQLKKGQKYFRSLTNYAAVAKPMLNCPSIANLILDDRIVDFATAYIGCLPVLASVNLRKSFANSLPSYGTQMFHSDPDSLRFIKFFWYLNDVDLKGGPFCYVQRSHRNHFIGWQSKVRWTNEEIENIYGRDPMKYLVASAGDLIVADTIGFHRGTKVESEDRRMLTISYALPNRLRGGPVNGIEVSKAVYSKLNAKQRELVLQEGNRHYGPTDVDAY